MLKNLNKLIAVGIVIIAVIGIAWMMKPKAPSNPMDAGTLEQVNKDLKALESSSPNMIELQQALMRLSIQQNPEALAFIRKKIEMKDEALAPWVTRALGYFTSDEAVQLLRSLLQSPSQPIRDAVIDALAMRPAPEKMKLLEEAKSVFKTDLEKARLDLASLRMSSDAATKEKITGEVIATLKKTELEPLARQYLVSQIFFQNPRSSEVEGYFNSLGSQLDKLDPISTVAFVRALKIYCPQNRFSQFERALKKQNLGPSEQSHILSELAFHGGPQARKLVDAVAAQKKVDANLLGYVKNRLETQTTSPVCNSAQASQSPTEKSPAKDPQAAKKKRRS